MKTYFHLFLLICFIGGVIWVGKNSAATMSVGGSPYFPVVYIAFLPLILLVIAFLIAELIRFVRKKFKTSK